MRRAAIVVLVVSCASCASRARQPLPGSPTGVPPSSPRASVGPSGPEPGGRSSCLVVGEPTGDLDLEGTLRARADGAHGNRLVLVLAAPRCVVGTARGSVLTEVLVVSDGFDLRPLLDQRIRVVGEVIADATDFDGPAVIVLAHEASRVVRDGGP